MADRAATLKATGTATRRFLTFRAQDRLYALPAEEVSEVIRTPPVARVPQGPKALLGIGNLRGAVVPVASLRGLLGLEDDVASAASRAIVLDGASPIALVVDAVDALLTLDADEVETDQAVLAAETGEELKGAFRLGDGDAVARILNIQTLLSASFAQRARPQRKTAVGGFTAERAETAADDRQMLVTFEIAGQEYALDLDAVREILPAPENLAVVPQTDAMVLGVTPHRDTVLPLLSLRGLLGFGPATSSDGRQKVLVTTIGGVEVGLLADRARTVLSADPDLLEPVPAALAARAGGEARIKSIYRGDGGRRLISILAPDQLFREDVMQRLAGADTNTRASTSLDDQAGSAEVQFLIFSLGADEFALPIASVDEVARAPEKITRLPKAPPFLEGVINLRGEVLPVVDQRRRFDMPPLDDGENRRLVVVRTERHTAGLIVDGVREVLRTAEANLEPAPGLTEDMNRLVQAVINLDETGRIILVLDPKELLSRAEQGLLDAFQADL